MKKILQIGGVVLFAYLYTGAPVAREKNASPPSPDKHGARELHGEGYVLQQKYSRYEIWLRFQFSTPKSRSMDLLTPSRAQEYGSGMSQILIVE